METQKRQILAYLQTGATLSPLEALQRFGCFRLAARIANLRDEGYDIVTFRDEVYYPDGTKKTFARYALKEN